MKAYFVLSLAILSCAASAPAGAQQVTLNYRAVDHGRSIKLSAYGSFDPDCRSQGRPAISLLTQPQGGQVEVENGYDFPAYTTNNARFTCDKRRLPQSVVYYRAARDFSGTDSFVIEVVFPPAGEVRQVRYNVQVR